MQDDLQSVRRLTGDAMYIISANLILRFFSFFFAKRKKVIKGINGALFGLSEKRNVVSAADYRITPAINVSLSLLFSSIYPNDRLLVDNSTSCILHVVWRNVRALNRRYVKRLYYYIARNVLWEHIASHKSARHSESARITAMNKFLTLCITCRIMWWETRTWQLFTIFSCYVSAYLYARIYVHVWDTCI